MATDISEFFGVGTPEIHLFDFVRGVRRWQYTSLDRDLIHQGQVYRHASRIERSAIKVGAEPRKLGITVTLDKRLDVLDNWRPFPPADQVALTIFVKRAGASAVSGDWTGRVVRVRPGDTTVEMTCEPEITQGETARLTRAHQRTCGHVFGSQGEGMCNVDLEAHKLPATLELVDGVSLQSPAFLALASGRLSGGFIQWVRADGLGDRRDIDTHAGNAITLDYPALDLAPGMTVDAYPSCDQSLEMCNDIYDNLPNNDAAPLMPVRDPYDGNPQDI